jgi:hypothetical protein
MLKPKIEARIIINMFTIPRVSHVNVGGTVQTKAILYATEARLYDRAQKSLVVHARKLGLSFRRI